MGRYRRELKRLVAVSVLAAPLLLASPGRADAALIEFTAVDLADVVPGEDLWMYEYLVSGFTFGVNQGFSVYFDPNLYANLQNPPPVISAEWDAITIQPDLLLSSDGIYDVLALVAGASLAQPFSLTFAWMGGPASAPGSQAFTINEFDPFGNITILQSGLTRPVAVPEPATLTLVASALLLAVCRRRSRR